MNSIIKKILFFIYFLRLIYLSGATRTTEFPLLDSLFPNNTLDEAWERYPLFVSNLKHEKSNTANEGSCMMPLKDAGNETGLHFAVSAKYQSFEKIININDIDTVMQHVDTNMIHGQNKDYSLVKRITRDGENWNGLLNFEKFKLEEIQSWFNSGGFTLVINKMQKRWKPIKRIASQIRSEVLSKSVSCNLYMTPPKMYGFEEHFDAMDVIVMQVSGKKMWTVANHPLKYLSAPDMKRKPTLLEVSDYMSPGNHTTVLLTPGDILYIPRGFIHNATTDLVNNESDEEISIHLTFGIEHGCQTTVESLIHYALHLYANDSLLRKTANPYVMTLLHYSISEISRNHCFSIHDRACVLRESLALHDGWAEVKYSRESSDFDSYNTALQEILELADMTRAIEFIHLLNNGQTSSGGLELGNFCFPPIVLGNNVQIKNIIEAEAEILFFSEMFHDTLRHFYSFGKEHYVQAKKLLVEMGK